MFYEFRVLKDVLNILLILIVESTSGAALPEDPVGPSSREDSTCLDVDNITFEISSDALQNTEENLGGPSSPDDYISHDFGNIYLEIFDDTLQNNSKTCKVWRNMFRLR